MKQNARLLVAELLLLEASSNGMSLRQARFLLLIRMIVLL